MKLFASVDLLALLTVGSETVLGKVMQPWGVKRGGGAEGAYQTRGKSGSWSPRLCPLILFVAGVLMAGARGGGLIVGASLPVPVCKIFLVFEVAQELSDVHLSPLHPAFSPRSLSARRVFPTVIDPRVGSVTRCGVGGRAPRIGRREDTIFRPRACCGKVGRDELLFSVAVLLIGNEHSEDFTPSLHRETSTSWQSGTRDARRSGSSVLAATARTPSGVDLTSRM
jgi:hypothetical protein